MGFHEQGRGVPRRATIGPASRRFIKQEKNGLLEEIYQKLDQRGYRGMVKRMDVAGVRWAADVKQAIVKKRRPAKKEATIRAIQRQYGGGRKDNPLIATSESIGSVTHWRK